MESTDDQAATPNDETILVEALELLRELDDTPIGQMNALFYQHGFEELNLTVRALLRIMGRDLD